MASSIRIKGLDEFTDRLKKYPNIYKEELENAMRDSTLVIQRKAKIDAPADRGDLRRSIFTENSAKKGIVGIGEPGRKYGIFVEKGTRPHWISGRHLQEWSRRKGINPYAVAAAIARRGTKARPFMEPAFTENVSKVKRFFEEAVKNIILKLTR